MLCDYITLMMEKHNILRLCQAEASSEGWGAFSDLPTGQAGVAISVKYSETKRLTMCLWGLPC